MYIVQLDTPTGDGSFFTYRGYGPDRDAAFAEAVRAFVLTEQDNWLNNYCTPDEVAAVHAMANALEAGAFDRVVELAAAMGVEVYIEEGAHEPPSTRAFEEVLADLKALEPVDEAPA